MIEDLSNSLKSCLNLDTITLQHLYCFILDKGLDVFQQVIFPFFSDLENPFHWIHLIVYLIVFLWAFLAQECWQAGTNVWLDYWKFCFPKPIYQHPQTILSLKYYVVDRTLNVLVRFGYSTTVIITVEKACHVMLLWIFNTTNFQPDSAYLSLNNPCIQYVYTIIYILAIDFMLFFSHYCLHKIPILWEFHAMHHSLEVLTPMASFLVHPVESIFRDSCVAVTIGILTGLSQAYLGGDVALAPLLLYFYVIDDFLGILYHSHVWISYGPFKHMLFSPAYHQIHHSIESRHINKNFGYMLVIWDYWFGTLYSAAEPEIFQMGLLEPDTATYETIWGLYWKPMTRALPPLFKTDKVI